MAGLVKNKRTKITCERLEKEERAETGRRGGGERVEITITF
jgi:hypothetical protein